ncbi:uncharacterized protein LOC115876580 [Sitophilus oryzae]|uniref:Uncharacterized protein LOC115876580 n=1 Tax=Sitophilus oryzae TaxID=7048 RepID=A0A6J2XAJ1_SITOR|nr:uncharacterized protein LOC115876580 [Sitophilus oryzae]
MAIPSLHLDLASQTQSQGIKETHAEREDHGYFEYNEGDLQNPHRVYVKSHISTQDFQNNSRLNPSDSTENTPITYVKTIHNYCASPTKWKEKYEALKIRHSMCMRKVCSANKKILRLELKISNMFKTIKQLKSQSK